MPIAPGAQRQSGDRLVAGLSDPARGSIGSRWWPPGPRTVIWAIAIIVVAGSIGALAAWATADPVQLSVSGVSNDRVLSGFEVDQVEIQITAGGFAAGEVTVEINGEPITVDDDGDRSVVRPGPFVREGSNDYEVRVAGRYMFGDRVVSGSFDVDLSGASVIAPTQLIRPAPGQETIVRGLVEDAVAVTVDGDLVEVDGGAFSATLVPTGDDIVVRAVHANGNSTDHVVELVDAAEAASRATYPETQAVRISARGWADPVRRQAVLDLVADGKINTVQLDIKDESGEIGYLSEVELAVAAGSTRDHYDPREAIEELHGLGVRVIGRVVCFLDPIVADWAWSEGEQQMVIQSPDGRSPFANNYGTAAFTNYADPDIQQFLIDLSVEAAELGFDDILYDYVRRPEGQTASMTVPGLDRAPTVEIAQFVHATAMALAPHEVTFGVSVFGVSSTRPNSVAQDIRLLAPLVDYVAPMVYPSHWGPGEYGVEDPVRQPADIVERSVADFHAVAAGNAAIVPWLQAFSSHGVTYGPDQVRAQIDATMAVGSSGFLLWNADSVYDPDGLAAP